MATGQQTTNFDWQNFYVAQLSSDITSSATDIFLNTVPTVSEGILIIEPDVPANSEVIYYNSKTGSKVTCPSAALGRGYDGSTAIGHLSGSKVIMAPVGDMFRNIRTIATTTPQGWSAIASPPTTVTALGNRSYSCVFNGVDYTSILSPGMRLKTTRTVAAPTQSTLLNGSTQYYSKTAPTGMTFTNNFVVSAWVKLSSYANCMIASRFDGTNGWYLQLNASGQLVLVGTKVSASNYSLVQCYQSIPLNKWVHVTAQLDMATFTATSTTSYIMIDGVDVPASVSRAGTNPTSLTQAGNLEIGSYNGGTFLFPGKIAQVAIYNAKVTQATILASMNQTLAGNETSLISAYSFNNSINDLNANANNLTANGSAVATNADSPFGLQANGTTLGTTEYGIITSAAFSTNTTLTVQVPEGNAIPTSGGVSAVSYSIMKVPYGMPIQRGKWQLRTLIRYDFTQSLPTTWYNVTGLILLVPIGSWTLRYEVPVYIVKASTNTVGAKATLSTINTSETDTDMSSQEQSDGSGSPAITSMMTRHKDYDIPIATLYYLNIYSGSASTLGILAATYTTTAIVEAENAYL